MPGMMIKMSVFGGGDPFVPAKHDWLPGTYLQGGRNGLVVSRGGSVPSYTTTFVEVFPPEASGGGFFRGEGDTIAEAEAQAWLKYGRSTKCAKHEWEARGYRNGGGFCKNCNTFGSQVFTAEQLGQYCDTCGDPTMWGEVGDDNGVDHWYCEKDIKAAQKAEYERLLALDAIGVIPENKKWKLGHYRFMLGLEE